MMDPFMMNMMGMNPGFNFNGAAPDQAIMQEMFRQNQATMEQMQAMMFQMSQQMVRIDDAYPRSRWMANIVIDRVAIRALPRKHMPQRSLANLLNNWVVILFLDANPRP